MRLQIFKCTWVKCLLETNLACSVKPTYISGYSCIQRQSIPSSFLILDIKTHFKSTAFNTRILHLTHQESKKYFLRAKPCDSYAQTPQKQHLSKLLKKNLSPILARGYPKNLIEKNLSYVKFTERSSALKQKKKNTPKQILPLETQCQPSLPNRKHVLIGKGIQENGTLYKTSLRCEKTSKSHHLFPLKMKNL